MANKTKLQQFKLNRLLQGEEIIEQSYSNSSKKQLRIKPIITDNLRIILDKKNFSNVINLFTFNKLKKKNIPIMTFYNPYTIKKNTINLSYSKNKKFNILSKKYKLNNLTTSNAKNRKKAYSNNNHFQAILPYLPKQNNDYLERARRRKDRIYNKRLNDQFEQLENCEKKYDIIIKDIIDKLNLEEKKI